MLASQGYATVSVRVNGINAQDDGVADAGADARATIVEAHLDHWVDLAAGHQVDLSRVVLVGHSRGGEGVDRASIQIPLSAPYRIVGQVLIAPTDFASQTAPYVPTVTLLPFCDGDVSDLQGQKFTDFSRDLAADDTSLKSTVLVMGANHNFFNTEWTPGIAAGAGQRRLVRRRQRPRAAAPTRSGSRQTQQQAVGTVYVAGAVHLFASGDQEVLPLFDGSRATVASLGAAQTLSHAIGGGRDVRVPGAGTSRSLTGGAETRFCRGAVDPTRSVRAPTASATPTWRRTGPSPTRSCRRGRSSRCPGPRPDSPAGWCSTTRSISPTAASTCAPSSTRDPRMSTCGSGSPTLTARARSSPRSAAGPCLRSAAAATWRSSGRRPCRSTRRAPPWT